jgi:hypothetical protein
VRVIHIETRVEVLLGVVDDDGDVVQQQPLQMRLPKLTEAALARVVAMVAEARAKLAEQVTQPTAPAEANGLVEGFKDLCARQEAVQKETAAQRDAALELARKTLEEGRR